MLIGAMADSHDNVPLIEAAVELFNRAGVQCVLHAGDFVAPFAVEPLRQLSCPVVAVLGNNDGERSGLAARFRDLGELQPYLATVHLAGRQIAVVHYPELAEPLAGSGSFDLVVYGHTHRVDQRQDKGLLLNPGETGGWLTSYPTIATVDLTTLQVHLHELQTP